MIKGDYITSLTPNQMRNIGFRYNAKTDVYSYRFSVYEYNNSSVLYCEVTVLENNIVNFHVFNSNDNTLYAPYYNTEFGKNDLIKVIDERIKKQFKRLRIEEVFTNADD